MTSVLRAVSVRGEKVGLRASPRIAVFCSFGIHNTGLSTQSSGFIVIHFHRSNPDMDHEFRRIHDPCWCVGNQNGLLEHMSVLALLEFTMLPPPG